MMVTDIQSKQLHACGIFQLKIWHDHSTVEGHSTLLVIFIYRPQLKHRFLKPKWGANAGKTRGISLSFTDRWFGLLNPYQNIGPNVLDGPLCMTTHI